MRDDPTRTGPLASTSHARERLERMGPERASDRDLLAVLISGGSTTEAERRAGELLRVFGSLRGLASATPRELEALRGTGRGLGRVSALRISAAFALGRRMRSALVQRGSLLKTSLEIFEHYHERLRYLRKERFLSILIDAKNRVIREELVSEGTLTASLVHPREVFAPAIRESAAGIVLVHNHPSGDPEPSPEDLEVTHRLRAVGELIGIRICDHVIIGDGTYVSFLERGILPPAPLGGVS
ncbi:MAG: DNA repair protein RadC [Planctomycetota bacterium]|nr:DNA repair protein RadC [Planctomycetota bacterium]